MKDPIENALEKMKPADLPPALMARLTAARPQAPLPATGGVAMLFRRWLLPLVAGACASVATIAFLQKSGDPVPTSLSAALPLPMEHHDYLLTARDVGVVVAPDKRPFRIVEVEWLEQDTVRSSAGGAGIRVETKRREVIPVALDIY